MVPGRPPLPPAPGARPTSGAGGTSAAARIVELIVDVDPASIDAAPGDPSRWTRGGRALSNVEQAEIALSTTEERRAAAELVRQRVQEATRRLQRLYQLAWFRRHPWDQGSWAPAVAHMSPELRAEVRQLVEAVEADAARLAGTVFDVEWARLRDELVALRLELTAVGA